MKFSFCEINKDKCFNNEIPNEHKGKEDIAVQLRENGGIPWGIGKHLTRRQLLKQQCNQDSLFILGEFTTRECYSNGGGNMEN